MQMWSHTELALRAVGLEFSDLLKGTQSTFHALVHTGLEPAILQFPSPYRLSYCRLLVCVTR